MKKNDVVLGMVGLSLCLAPLPLAAWDPIEDLTGKPLHEHGEHIIDELSELPGSLVRCIERGIKCPEERLRELPYKAFSPVIERYKSHLFNQVGRRWDRLPDYLADGLASEYPEIDLCSVRFAEDIDTLHGQAITWHYHIFFPRRIDFYDRGDLHWMLHELEHVVQYEETSDNQDFRAVESV